MPTPSTLLMSEILTHDVQRLLLSKPEGMDWMPGQGIEVQIDADEWREEARPFTPTSLPEDRILELAVKRYPEHDGFTVALHGLRPGAQLLLGDPFGSIGYQGPGTFIAAGTGVTPFLAILRQLALQDSLEGHQLLLTNKCEQDVICREELQYYLGERCVLTFTHEHDPGQEGRHIDAAFLAAHIDRPDQVFYVCGPQGFVESINAHLLSLGVHPNSLVYER
ncbi:flavodoxin reductase [Allochromatium palmeri]|uniref:Flavodoxin reductase n=2 Tax=Allochromatium palmeri TaxID=231048 RepID=A0A6N8EDW9_9GAMM|nr:flavodoxin reductase [Allochromatium palmeri]